MNAPLRTQPRTLTRTDFPGGSWQSQVLSLTLRATVKQILRIWAPTRRLPWPTGLIDHAGRVLTGVRGVSFQPVLLPHCRAELVTPAQVASDRFVVYLHGGGFHVGGRYLHRQMIARFAHLLHAPLLHVNYRQLPRHSIANAITDCLDGYRHALKLGIDPGRIVVMGDSGGGYLTFTTALAARDTGLPRPGALVVMAPFTDWDPTAKATAPSAATCAVFPPSALPALLGVATQRNRDVGLISPARCDLTGLPPTLIQTSKTEMLYPDAVSIADRLAADGVPCQLQVWDRQVHVFQAAATLLPEAAQAVTEIVRFVDDAVPAGRRSPRADVRHISTASRPNTAAV